MPDLLFEIGTEELPPSAVRAGEMRLRSEIDRLLADNRIVHGDIVSYATPRRLAVLVRDVAAGQDPFVEERRGPPVAQGIGADGSYAPAAVGFARANGIEPADLVRRQTEGGEYLFAVRELQGLATADVLPGLLAESLAGLQFPKTMRWDASKTRFPRPIRWLVALFGADVVPVSVGELTAGRTSYGHRVAHPGPLEIAQASDYERAIRAAGVVAGREERMREVRGGAERAAATLGGRAILRPGVVEEVTDLVEAPAALAGRFEERFLEIPREVLITSMESHQRYFGVEDADGGLMAGFVVVANGRPAEPATVVSGNERVLRARLEDARFFYREDAKTSLAARTEQLGGVVFHGRLGSMRDKVLRVGAVLGPLVTWLDLSDEDADAAFFAADLCKADLLTHLVYEFPELQGTVGAEYALRDPELAEQAGPMVERVAAAIREHYLPRFAGDELPSAPSGVALGLADRIDTLTGYVGIGEMPTGSEDPFALRRQAGGFAAISIEREARVSLPDAIRASYEQYARQGVELGPLDEVTASLTAFITNRAEAFLERSGIARRFVEAASGSDWKDLPDLAARARALTRLHETGRLRVLAVAHERAHNLSSGAGTGDVDPGALVHESEQNLYDQLQAVEEVAVELAGRRDYAGVLDTLVPLSLVVDVLFDRDRGVMIMDPDERLRRNRLALLDRTAKVFSLVADFTVQSMSPALLEDGAGAPT